MEKDFNHRFLENILEPGCLVFDVGANIGEKAEYFRQYGAKVICFEPQPACLEQLENKFRDKNDVIIINKGLSDKKEILNLSVSSNLLCLSTFSEEWKKGRFRNNEWDTTVPVEVVTLDEMIGIYGVPRYCKIDVEGFEYKVLKGLSQTIPCLSFEFAMEFLQSSKACLDYLGELGFKYFNFAIGEKDKFVFRDWVSAQELIIKIINEYNPLLWGDIYASLEMKHEKEIYASTKTEKISESSETDFINKFFKAGDVIFEIGAYTGAWSKAVLDAHPDIKVYAFEPLPQNFKLLRENLAEYLNKGNFFPNNCALGLPGSKKFIYYYNEVPGWSSFYRKFAAEKVFSLAEPRNIQVNSTTLAQFCKKQNIIHINYLKISVEGGELDVLIGLKNLLESGMIDIINFEYSENFLNAGISLKEVFSLLQRYNYEFFKINPSGPEHKPDFLSGDEDYFRTDYFVLNERLQSEITGKKPAMIDLKKQCENNLIIPRGIIHIGAHEGNEVNSYLKMGIKNILFIEANPEVFEKLRENIKDFPNVRAVNFAISNKNGTISFHVTSFDQCSSILPLKKHLELNPNITEVKQITVPSKTLDTLLKDLNLNPENYNLLNIDIQGAELLALEGAVETLKYIEAVISEVNFAELYEGCALIWQIDEFLKEQGFRRRFTTTPWHPSWGDAFYIRQPVISFSRLGNDNRFAHQLFQYAFLKIYAREYGLQAETPEWLGKYLFGAADPPVVRELPFIKEETVNFSGPSPKFSLNSKDPLFNYDIWGYFQYRSDVYRPFKEYFRSLFRPVPELREKLDKCFNLLRSKGKTIIGLRLKEDDPGYEVFSNIPVHWYKFWLEENWHKYPDPVLLLTDSGFAKSEFSEFNPVTSGEIGIDLKDAAFFPDFYYLSKCDISLVSNSSFSFAACMLNEDRKHFFRPDLSQKKLVGFDPWDSEILIMEKLIFNTETGETISKLTTGDLEKIFPPVPKKSEIGTEKFFYYSNLFFKLGNYHEAIDYLTRAFKLGIFDYDLCQMMAESLEKIGDLKTAAIFYQKANSLK
jgi:FkbM family methyltransferase